MIERIDFKVLGICFVFMFVGPALILINQYVLKSLNFPYPMFLSGLGVLASAIFAQIVVRTGYVTLQRKEAIEGLLWYKRVLPVGFTHACTLAFGNTVYLYLNVGFIQMLKSFTPVILMLTGWLARIDIPTMPVVYSVLIIAIGTAATCSFSPELNLVGIFIMFMAELTEAIRLICTQFFLQQLRFGVVEGQYVLAPASAFWLFLASLIYESRDMYNNGALQIILDNIPIFLIASCMGIAVNYLSYLVIQSTSSLTMKILGTARNIMVIIIGVMFYAEVITLNEALGYLVALVGFIGYNMAKSGQFDNAEYCSLSCLGGGSGDMGFPRPPSALLPMSVASSRYETSSPAVASKVEYDRLELDSADIPTKKV